MSRKNDDFDVLEHVILTDLLKEKQQDWEQLHAANEDSPRRKKT